MPLPNRIFKQEVITQVYELYISFPGGGIPGFLLIFLTAGNLIAIGGYKMPGVWGQRPQRGPAPLAGSEGQPLAGSEGQRPWRGPGAAPLEAIRFSQSDKVKSTQPVMHK